MRVTFDIEFDSEIGMCEVECDVTLPASSRHVADHDHAAFAEPGDGGEVEIMQIVAVDEHEDWFEVDPDGLSQIQRDKIHAAAMEAAREGGR